MTHPLIHSLDGWSVEQAERWAVWQRANVLTARRNGRIAGVAAALVLGVMLITLVAALVA